MTIKEFFENYRQCYDVSIFIYGKNNRLEWGGDIDFSKDFDNFIKDQGDKEFKEWTVEYREECTQFYFCLK